jgi:hypothetical protein
VENIAEEVGAPPRKLQEFLSDSPWDDEGCIEEHQRFAGELFGAPNGVVIFDDTGFPKKGDKSAGVVAPRSCTRDGGNGPPGSAYRCRFQTTSSCCGQKPWWLALRKRRTKIRQVGIKKVSDKLTNGSVESK